MNAWREAATRAMRIITDHYPEYLAELGLVDTPTERFTYYLNTLKMVRRDPFLDPKGQSILESKLSKQIFLVRDEAVAEARSH